MTHHYIIMGICGCGKTTVAEALQQHLHCPFAEGDDFHTQANRDKMGAGIPLNDDDRRPWLERLRDWMSEQAQHGASLPAPRSNTATAIFCGRRKVKCILCICRPPSPPTAPAWNRGKGII